MVKFDESLETRAPAEVDRRKAVLGANVSGSFYHYVVGGEREQYTKKF